MNNYKLGFMSDEDIFEHVKDTALKYRFQMDLRKFKKNLIDPIKLTFDAKIYNKKIEEVIENEIIRQMDKSNTNHIGYFHQNIFRYMGKGWRVLKKGYDIINEEKQYFIEIKNKHNTMNSSSSQKTYMRMQDTLLNNQNATCMLVEVIAADNQNKVWKISLDGKSMSNERIRRVSIDKFYEIVTGDPIAFKKLCENLPLIIDDVVKSSEFSQELNSVVKELTLIDKNLLKSIYLLSFKKYEGFDQFEIQLS